MENKAFNTFNKVIESIIKYFKLLIIISIILFILSGVYKVDSNELAVVLRFGQLVGNNEYEQVKQPGLHFAFPFFIDEIIKIPVQKVHERTITTHYGSGGSVSSNVNNNGYVLTGDNNIVLIKIKVKYRIGDVVKYALYSSNPENCIDGIISAELTEYVTSMNIDEILTIGKEDLADKSIKSSQRILDEIDCGIILNNIELTEVVPPKETKDFFEAVVSASVQKETKIQAATETASNILLEAEATSSSIKQEAITKQTEALTKVASDMAQFNGILEQYKTNPAIIENGVFRQRVGNLFTKMGGSVIVQENQKTPVIVLP